MLLIKSVWHSLRCACRTHQSWRCWRWLTAFTVYCSWPTWSTALQWKDAPTSPSTGTMTLVWAWHWVVQAWHRAHTISWFVHAPLSSCDLKTNCVKSPHHFEQADMYSMNLCVCLSVPKSNFCEMGLHVDSIIGHFNRMDGVKSTQVTGGYLDQFPIW